MRLLVAQVCHLLEAVAPDHRQVHRRSQRQQPLVGADVGGGFLAFDVLFAGGEGQHVAALSARVDRFSYQAASHFVDVLLASGEEAKRGAAIPHRDAERLAFAHDDIGAHRARRFEQGQGNGVGNPHTPARPARARHR